ncbi:hypothetical protein [Halocatena salina]|nr:hypothetical protein [Halocatena salina]
MAGDASVVTASGSERLFLPIFVAFLRAQRGTKFLKQPGAAR